MGVQRKRNVRWNLLVHRHRPDCGLTCLHRSGRRRVAGHERTLRHLHVIDLRRVDRVQRSPIRRRLKTCHHFPMQRPQQEWYPNWKRPHPGSHHESCLERWEHLPKHPVQHALPGVRPREHPGKHPLA